MIAIALAAEPRLLIADEPTTALDVTVQAQILDLLADIQQEMGLAIMLITHDLAVAKNVADYVALIRAGELAKPVDPPRFFDAPRPPSTRPFPAPLPPSPTPRNPPHEPPPPTPPHTLTHAPLPPPPTTPPHPP